MWAWTRRRARAAAVWAAFRAVPLELEEKPIKGAAPRHARLLQTSSGVRAARSRHRLAMRVLVQGRERTASRRGGDSTVADRLARELESFGHDVVIASRPPEGGLGGFDVVHAINLDRSVLTETEILAT